MLDKQPGDPDGAGIGALVEENFFNLGIGDHSVQALNALQRGQREVFLRRVMRRSQNIRPKHPLGASSA